MPNLINNDTTNNLTYLNYFDSSSNGIINTLTNASSVNVRDACRTRWGANSCQNQQIGTGRNYLVAFPNSSRETKTDKTASSSNYRIAFLPLSMATSMSGAYGYLNYSSSTGSEILAISQNVFSSGSVAFSGCYEYAVITNENISVSGFASSGSSLNTGNWQFNSSGWLYDTPSIIGGGALYHLFINQNIVSNSLGFRVSGGPTAQPLLTSGLAQYPISCLSDTGDGIVPGSNLWATDLWVRDSPGGFVIGRIPHVLLCKTTTLALGNLVKINTVINGITDQRIWLVAANYGADKLLMRVYTEGIE